MPLVKIKETAIYYEIHGKGAYLLLISGLGGSTKSWTHQIPYFKKFFTVIIFDNIGSGLSSKPDEPYSITMLAEDTVGLLEAIKVDRVYVLGISMGGLIAQEIAINYPEKVQGLVLVNTHCGGENAFHPTDNVRQVFLDNQGSSEEISIEKSIFFLVAHLFRTFQNK